MSNTDIDWIGGVCRKKSHATAVYDKKIYVLGGSEWQMFPPRFNFSSAYATAGLASTQLRILDFSKSFTTTPSSSTIESIKRLPDSVALTQLMLVQPSTSDGKIHMWGGQPTYHAPVQDNGLSSSGGRQLLGNTVWTYDIAKNEWRTVENTDVGEKPTGVAANTYDPVTSRGWVFAGTYERLGYYTFPPGTAPPTAANWTALGPPSGPTNYYKDWKTEYRQLTLGAELKFKDITAPPISPNVMHDMKSVYLQPNGHGGTPNGTVITFGGSELVTGSNRIPFRDAYIFDPATDEWYTQPLTAENGNFPSTRWQACAQAARAPDGSSWNIYMYGGIGDAGKTIFQDLYILTIPAFHWVYVGAFGARAMHTCDIVAKDDRYLAVYRGQMVTAQPGDCTPGAGADDGGGLSILDMTDLAWTRKYVVDRKYEVPKRISAIIGGDANGGATMLAPRSGFVSDRLAALFKYEPTKSDNPDPSKSGTPNPNTSNSPGNNPPGETSTTTSGSNKGAIIGGVVGGIAFLLLLLIAWYILRRRRRSAAGNVAAIPHPSELPGGNQGGVHGNNPYAVGGAGGYPNHGHPTGIQSPYLAAAGYHQPQMGELDGAHGSKTVMEHYHPGGMYDPPYTTSPAANGGGGGGGMEQYGGAVVAPQAVNQQQPGELYVDTSVGQGRTVSQGGGGGGDMLDRSAGPWTPPGQGTTWSRS